MKSKDGNQGLYTSYHPDAQCQGFFLSKAHPSPALPPAFHQSANGLPSSALWPYVPLCDPSIATGRREVSPGGGIGMKGVGVRLMLYLILYKAHISDFISCLGWSPQPQPYGVLGPHSTPRRHKRNPKVTHRRTHICVKEICSLTKEAESPQGKFVALHRKSIWAFVLSCRETKAIMSVVVRGTQRLLAIAWGYPLC